MEILKKVQENKLLAIKREEHFGGWSYLHIIAHVFLNVPATLDSPTSALSMEKKKKTCSSKVLGWQVGYILFPTIDKLGRENQTSDTGPVGEMLGTLAFLGR